MRERRGRKREEKVKEDGGKNLLYIVHVQTVCNKGTYIQCTCTILVHTHNYFL